MGCPIFFRGRRWQASRSRVTPWQLAELLEDLEGEGLEPLSTSILIKRRNKAGECYWSTLYTYSGHVRDCLMMEEARARAREAGELEKEFKEKKKAQEREVLEREGQEARIILDGLAQRHGKDVEIANLFKRLTPLGQALLIQTARALLEPEEDCGGRCAAFSPRAWIVTGIEGYVKNKYVSRQDACGKVMEIDYAGRKGVEV